MVICARLVIICAIYVNKGWFCLSEFYGLSVRTCVWSTNKLISTVLGYQVLTLFYGSRWGDLQATNMLKGADFIYKVCLVLGRHGLYETYTCMSIESFWVFCFEYDHELFMFICLYIISCLLVNNEYTRYKLISAAQVDQKVCHVRGPICWLCRSIRCSITSSLHIYLAIRLLYYHQDDHSNDRFLLALDRWSHMLVICMIANGNDSLNVTFSAERLKAKIWSKVRQKDTVEKYAWKYFYLFSVIFYLEKAF